MVEGGHRRGVKEYEKRDLGNEKCKYFNFNILIKAILVEMPVIISYLSF